MIGPIIVFVLHNLLLLFLLLKSRKRIDYINNRSYINLFVVFVVLSIVGLQTGDYYHHIDLIKDAYNALKGSQDISSMLLYLHMEPIYNYLALWLSGDYILWRAVVFGSSFAIIFYFIRRLSFNYWSFFFIFTLISLSGFIVGRMYWGVALFVCSVAYARMSGNKWYLLLSLLCIFAHKCLYVLPLFIPFAYIRLNKKSILVLIIAYVFMSFALRFAFADLSIFDTYFEGFSSGIQYYYDSDVESEASVFGRSAGEKLIYFTEFSAVLLLALNMIYRTVKNRILLPNFIQSCLVLGISFLLFALAVVVGDFGPGILAWRYITVAWFPLIFAICYFKESRLFTHKIWSLSFGLLLLSFEASLTVPIFYASVQ